MVNNISLSEVFKHEIETEYPELFKGISCMDGEISIKLKEGAIPHVEPIRHVPHAMQEPLGMELKSTKTACFGIKVIYNIYKDHLRALRY